MSPAGSELAARLRGLRDSRWPNRVVTQPELAAALGMATSSVSSWENKREPKVPPLHRLRAIATFFATTRSLDGPSPRVLDDGELTDEERTSRERLLLELTGLVAGDDTGIGRVATAPADFWRFPDGGPVRIIAGRLGEGLRPPIASGTHRNYVGFSAYGDQDSVVEIFGQIRAQNPQSDVRYRLATRLENPDMRSHLVIVGNLGVRVPINSFTGDRIPVRQIDDGPLPDGEVFEVTEPDGSTRLVAPRFQRDQNGLLEDVGYLMRMRVSPYNRARSLTVVSGVYTRGVFGTVRCTIDSQHGAQNQRHLIDKFGSADCFGVLMRVPTYDHVIGTPILPEDILFEFAF